MLSVPGFGFSFQDPETAIEFQDVGMRFRVFTVRVKVMDQSVESNNQEFRVLVSRVFYDCDNVGGQTVQGKNYVSGFWGFRVDESLSQ